MEGCLEDLPDFFFLFPLAAWAGSTKGPDQEAIGAVPFWYGKTVLKDVSAGSPSKGGSMWCDEPRGKPRAPSW